MYHGQINWPHKLQAVRAGTGAFQVHSQIAPRSLFSESVKETIRSTASNFMHMMPKFAARLAQREFDFLLVNPMKRRMLLKMYCMGE